MKRIRQEKIETPRLHAYRSVDEMAFDFTWLLHRRVAFRADAVTFESLWEEANDAAMAYIAERRAEPYISFLKSMKSAWPFNPAFS